MTIDPAISADLDIRRRIGQCARGKALCGVDDNNLTYSVFISENDLHSDLHD